MYVYGYGYGYGYVCHFTIHPNFIKISITKVLV